MKNLPPRFELNWYLNDHKLNPTTVNNLETTETNYVLLPSSNNREVRVLKTYRQVDSQNISQTYLAIVDRVHNVTVSRLKIRELDWFHKGVYKCKYDQAEAYYNLDFESNKNDISLLVD